jgi:hypothetical protein
MQAKQQPMWGPSANKKGQRKYPGVMNTEQSYEVMLCVEFPKMIFHYSNERVEPKRQVPRGNEHQAILRGNALCWISKNDFPLQQGKGRAKETLSYHGCCHRPPGEGVCWTAKYLLPLV